MGKTLIKIDCVDQRLLVSSGPIIASGGRNEDEIEFNFCSLWNGFEKTAVFYRDKNSTYHVVISGNRCVIPREILADEGWMYFGVFGVKDDITRTSEIMRYRIAEGAITEGTKPSDPTPDLWEQVLAAAADKVSMKQGAENAGKILGIGDDGIVTLLVATTSGVTIDKTLSHSNQAADAKAVGDALKNKVDVVAGKALSSNDYTDEDKLAVERHTTDIKNVSSRVSDLENYTPRPFKIAGETVVIDNFEGIPMRVMTTVEPVWAGNGDPSPDNIRALSARTSATLTHNDAEHVIDFGQDVYAGSIDWNAGVLTVTHGLMTLRGDEIQGTSTVSSTTGETANTCVWLSTNDMSYGNFQPGWCSHLHNHGSMRNKNTIRFGATSGSSFTRTIYIYLDSSEFADLAAYKDYVAAQAAAGTPVQILYPLATPITIRFTPAQIRAFSGSNALSADVGKSTVSGRTDVLWVTRDLYEQIDTLKAAIISLGGAV